MQTSSVDESVLTRGVWPWLFASNIAPEQLSCFSSPCPGCAPGLGPCHWHLSGADILAGGSSVAPGFLGLASLAPAQPFPEDVLELQPPDRSPRSGLTLHRGPRLRLSAECLGHFGLWRPRERGRRYRAEPAPCLQCHPSVTGHIQGWQCPLTTPSAHPILFAAPSASPLHAVTTRLPSRTTGQPPKAAALMAGPAASGVRGSHPGPWRAAVVGARVACKEPLRPGVGAGCRVWPEHP